MENENFDLEKVIQEMDTLKIKIMDKLKQDINASEEKEFDEKKFSDIVTVKYLGKIELINEQGELIEKDWYAVIEQQGSQLQITYYDENQEFLGQQMGMDGDIVPSESLMWNMPQKMNELKKEDIEKAKSIEQLKEEKNQEEQKNEVETIQEEQQLPGLQDDYQLSKEQVDSMSGPKTELNQIVDGKTLRNIIGLDGKYMQIVDVDKEREKLQKYIPDFEIPTNQRTLPIEIFPDGTANVIGEDKLKFSNQEGLNSAEDHVTVTNEGTVRNEQNIETYNIASKGGMHTIAVGYDESGGTPLEVKYGWRDPENPTEIAYSELETVHEGPLQQDEDARLHQQDASAGIDKGQDTIESAVEKYAIAMNIRKVDEHGYPTQEYDLDTAKQELEKRWTENPDATLDELIDEGQMQRGPQNNGKW